MNESGVAERLKQLEDTMQVFAQQLQIQGEQIAESISVSRAAAQATEHQAQATNRVAEQIKNIVERDADLKVGVVPSGYIRLEDHKMFMRFMLSVILPVIFTIIVANKAGDQKEVKETTYKLVEKAAQVIDQVAEEAKK